MRTRGLKALVLAAALMVMPLQGIAATLSFLLCHGEAQAHTAHATHPPGDGHGHGAHHDGRHDGKAGDEGSAGASPYHLCCHFTVTTPADIALATAPPDFPVLARAPDILRDLFVPDRPQRPPLA
jgi:hypothetical protein